jgi:hypothetical protein
MPRQTIATPEAVDAAVEEIVASGKHPSVRLVMQTLGGGSPAKILKLLRARTKRTSPIHGADLIDDAPPSAADGVLQDPVLSDLEAAVSKVRKRLISYGVERAAEATRVERAAADQAAAAHNATMAAAKATIDELNADLEMVADMYEASCKEAERLTVDLTDARHTNERLKAERDEIARDRDWLRTLVTDRFATAPAASPTLN